MRYLHFIAFGFYAAAAILITYPLITVIDSDLFGGFLTDAFQTARHVWWIKHALQTGQPIFFQPTFGYPDGLSGAWLWSSGLEYFPGWLYAFVMPLNVAVNLMMLTHVTLNGWAMYLLARHLFKGAFAPALLTGLIFLAYPAMQGRIYGGHAGVLALFPMPLYLYAVFHLRDSDAWRWYIMAAVCCALGVAGNSTLLVYYVLPVAGLMVLRTWFYAAPPAVESRYTASFVVIRNINPWFFRTLIATLAGGILSLVFLVPLALETASTPTYDTTIGGTVTYSADLLAVVSPSFFHPLFGRLEYTGRVLGTNLLEGTAYVGIAAAVLAVIALWKQRESRWLFWLALLAWVFSLGPLLKVFDSPVIIETDGFASYIPMPWSLMQRLPIIDISRTPGRFNLTVGLAVALLAGYGAAYMWEKARYLRWRWGMIALLGMFILYEYQMFWGMPSIPAFAPEGVIALRDRDDIRAVYNVPSLHYLLSKNALYMQTLHQQNILDGKYVRDTPVNPAKLRLLQATLDPALLDAAGADVVLWFKEGGTEGERLSELTYAQLGTPTYEDDYIAVFDVPDAPPAGFMMAMDNWRVLPSWIEGELFLTSSHSVYLYAPQAGWVNYNGLVTGDGSRVDFYMDDTLIHSLSTNGETPFDVPVYLPQAGFYTIRTTLNPVCPRFEHPALACRQVTLADLSFGDFIPAQDGDIHAVQFANGLTLEQAAIPQQATAGALLPVRLWWHFDTLPTDADSRFVHVVDADNELVMQEDGPPAIVESGSIWAESLDILLPADLAPGTYRVYTGWYRYPDFDRFEILSDVPEAQNRVVLLGTFEIK